MLDPDKREKHRKSNQGDTASQRKKRLIVDKPEGYRGWSNRDPNRTHGTGIRIRLILITCLASVLLQLGQSSHPPQCGLLLLQSLQDLGVDRNLLLRFLILLKVDATKQGVGLKLVWKEAISKLGGVPNRKHYLKSGNPHLTSDGQRINYWLVLLSLQDLLVRNQLHLFLQRFLFISKTT